MTSVAVKLALVFSMATAAAVCAGAQAPAAARTRVPVRAVRAMKRDKQAVSEIEDVILMDGSDATDDALRGTPLAPTSGEDLLG